MTLLVPPQWSLRQTVEAVEGTLEVSWPDRTGLRRWAVRWRNHVMDTKSPSILWDWLETLGAIRLLTDKEAAALGAALGGPVPAPCARCGARVYMRGDEVGAWQLICLDCGDGAPDGGFNTVDAPTVTAAITRWNDQQAEEREERGTDSGPLSHDRDCNRDHEEVLSVNKLPDKPSELIRVALTDLEACMQDGRYKIHMGDWHLPRGGACYVCLAGAVIAKRLGALPHQWREPGQYDFDTEAKLSALDGFRGSIAEGLMEMDIPCPNGLSLRAPLDEDDTPALIAYLTDAAAKLEEHGL